MGRKEKLQWEYIEAARQALMKWADKSNVNISAIHFIPMADFSLEVYVFYACDDEIKQNQTNGISDKIKMNFLNIISGMGYIKYFGNNISFIFDSHENVIKNFEGSYFLRLR